MRYRKLSPNGDFTFGASQLNFFVNSPEAVAQAVETSLKLWLGEWYLNVNDGTPYLEGIIGKHSKATADSTLVAQISKVQGVVNVENFSSVIDPVTRRFSASCVLNTIYGQTQLQLENIGNF